MIIYIYDYIYMIIYIYIYIYIYIIWINTIYKLTAIYMQLLYVQKMLNNIW